MESVNLFSELAGVSPLWIALAVIWTLVWKGLALWRAAALQQKRWFIAILVVNTLGILEIIYIFLVAKKYQVEIIDETK